MAFCTTRHITIAIADLADDSYVVSGRRFG
jgi:hypothetical protein